VRLWLWSVTRIVLIALLARAVSGGLAEADPPAGKPLPIRDKTLVAWVYVANLTQRGGSALTLENPGGVFDAIVFGELARGKWMAGSNIFARTQRQQSGYPAEKADPKTPVQIAIVYKGKQVTLYRNGLEYADYRMGPEPVVFSTDSVVLMGLRHLDAGGARFFAGSIDDARVYDLALDAKTIASLKPNEPSDPKPAGWWNFEDGKAEDLMKTFPAGKLVGGAKIADGRLHLDGRSGLMVVGATVRSAGPAIVGAPGPDAIDNLRTLRTMMARDPHRPGYHFVNPDQRGMPFDPNGAIFWKGRYHLFYIFQDGRGHNWGHASSIDLFHWRHHPTGLVSGMFSGNAFVNKDGKPTMCYHQVGQGNAMAVALDDQLNQWEKLPTNPITPKTQEGDPHHGKYRSWDPYGWVEDDTYYAIFGGKRPAVAKCKTLGGDWQYAGDLLAHAVEGVSINEDVSCADLFKIGDKRMLLCISHGLGARYYLGRWRGEQFHPQFHERMSWVDNEFFAPESLLDDRGRRIMWAWIFDRRSGATRGASGWSGTMSLPRVLSLDKDGRLRMRPPEEIRTLRYNPWTAENLTVQADAEVRLKDVGGKSIELSVEMAPGKGARQFGMKVCCSPDGQEQTLVYYDAADRKLKVDTRQSGREGPKKIEAAPLELPAGQTLRLRVFVDKSVVEVFANDGRQAIARRIYPSRADSGGVVLFSDGGAAEVISLQAWDMMPSNPF